LPGRHAACILVGRVEKPTDNRPARLLCYRAADDSRRSDQPRVGPRRISLHPPRAWARGYFDVVTGPVLRAGPDVDTRPHSPSGGNAKGTEVACGCHHRAQPHAGGITHGRSGIPWAEKWPSIGILLERRNPDIRAESARSAGIDSLRIGARPDLFADGMSRVRSRVCARIVARIVSCDRAWAPA
jgi:hypothetical protein